MCVEEQGGDKTPPAPTPAEKGEQSDKQAQPDVEGLKKTVATLQAEKAELADTVGELKKQVSGIAQDRKQISDAKKTVEEQLADLKKDFATEKDLREKSDKLAQAEAKKGRRAKSVNAVLDKLPKSVNAKTARKVVDSLDINLDVEDPSSVVDDALKALKKDHPELVKEVEVTPSVPRLPSFTNSEVQKEKIGLVEKDGKALL